MTKSIVFDFYKVIFDPHSKKIDKKVLDIVVSLKKRKFPLYIFTNSSREGVERIDKKYFFLKHFNNIIYPESYPKPHREAFKKLIDEIGTNPSNIVLIDDNPSVIGNAEDLGMKAILYINPDNLEKSLLEILPEDESKDNSGIEFN